MKDETLPSAWYCPNHPPGNQLLNFCERECWGCGEKRPPDAAVIKLNDLEPVGDVGELPRAKLATFAEWMRMVGGLKLRSATASSNHTSTS